MQTKAHPSHVDQRVAELAARQGGVIAGAQLRAIGVGAGAIKYRVAAGRLHPIPGHRAVFLVGHVARTLLTMYWAAHLALGPASVISHRSAAALRELRRSRSAFVELTVPGPSRRRGRGLRVHRTTWLPGADVEEIDGLPVTSVARTLLDLGAVVPYRGVERAFDQADRAGVLDLADVGRVLHEGAARPGAATLRAVAARDAAGTTLTETHLEELLLAIVRRAGLPEPVCQHPVLEYRTDLCWPGARLIAEADGPAHDTPAGRIHDARRDVRLQNAGWRVLRFPKREILGDPVYVADAIARALRL
jgi:very-short-patch-repair endonuclease